MGPRITVWNEYLAERQHSEAAAVYPQGIHHTIAEGLRDHSLDAVRRVIANAARWAAPTDGPQPTYARIP